MKRGGWSTWLGLAVGVALFGTGIVLVVMEREVSARWRSVEGTVVAMEATGSRGAYPVVEYVVEGTRRTHQASRTDKGAHLIGDKVPLLVNPDDASEVTMDSMPDRWMSAIASLVFGAAIAGIAATGLRRRRA